MRTAPSERTAFKVNFEGTPEKAPTLAAFVFSKTGKLLETAPVKEGNFTLKTDDAALHHTQILIAPLEEKLSQNPSIEDLEKVNAYQAVLQFDNNLRLKPEFLPIPEIVWQGWFFCSCRVRGQVVKPLSFWFFEIDMPVCHARVHICRLKSRLLTLRDKDLFNLRDLLLDPDTWRIKKPFPFPEPGPDPAPDFSIARFSKANTMAISTSKKAFDIPLSIDLKNRLKTNSAIGIKRALIDYVPELQLVIPNFCILNFLYSCEEVAMTETDSNGRFDVPIFESCFNQNHDYYIWVEYLINGVWETVYAPSYCVGAHWNYVCGTNLTIKVTDARIPWSCRPTVTGSFVEVVQIGGSGTPVSHINQPAVTNASTFARAPLSLTNNDGMIDYNDTVGFRPFGHVLDIHANFGDAFPSTDATHYQVSFKKSSEPDTSWKPINKDSLYRYYNEAVTSGGITVPITKGFKLLDDDGIGFYKLTHEDAKDEPTLNNKCVWANDVFVISSLDTRALDNDWYDIKMELYKKTGATYTLSTVAKTVWQMPNPSNPAVAQPCDDKHLMLSTQGGVTSHAFRMSVRIDNQKCKSRIFDVSIDGHLADDDCGFLNYNNATNEAILAFNASHPLDFATFDFRVTRGNNNGIGLDVIGNVTQSAPSSYVGSNITDNTLEGVPPALATMHGRNFMRTMTVNTLIAGLNPMCNGRAAFAQRLLVHAIATNGYRTLYEYDASEKLAAFAIVPTPPPTA